MSDYKQKIEDVNMALEKIKRGDADGIVELYHEMSHTLRYIALKFCKMMPMLTIWFKTFGQI